MSIEKIVSLCKRRGFVFQSSEIYGGFGAIYDYGPLGITLKKNISQLWWRDMTQLHENIVGLDSGILMHPITWEASGHVNAFNDPLVDCKECKSRYRSDELVEEDQEKIDWTTIQCPRCGTKGKLTEPRQFNLMFKTNIGPVEDDAALTQFLSDGAREIISIFAPNLRETCYSKQTFTSAAANSEAETMVTGQLGSVYAGSVSCRQIKPMDKHKASDSGSIEYASATDPVYYIEGGKINILPASSSGIYYVISTPSVAHGDSAITNFPNEAEYLVVLYAAIKAGDKLMVSEEDPEIIAPMIATLKQDYDKGIKMLAGGKAPTQSQKLGDIAIPK